MSGIEKYANNPYCEQTQQRLSKSDIFGILQNDRRRYLLEILHKDGEQSVRSLSEEIAHLEFGVDGQKSNFRRSIYASLHQTHIPKMESMKIITYNRERDSIKLLPISHEFDVYIETVKKGDIPWNQFYLGLSILVGVGSLTIFTGLIKWVSSFQWILFTNIIFIVTSLAYTYHIQIRSK